MRCIESLRKNSWARYTDVYIALDYPTKEEHTEGYEKILDYLKGEFKEFSKFIVIRRPYNYGAAKNMVDLRTDILKKYDRFIRTDDDCEFSPNFIEYMDICLEKYKDDPNVLGVTGYSYPVQWKVSEGCNAFRNRAIFPMWGTGFWKDKFLEMQNQIHGGCIKSAFVNGKIKRCKMTDARYIDVMNNVLKKDNLLYDFCDVACGCFIQINNKYVITPVKSLVRNYGFDGSGIYCQNTINLKVRKKNASEYDYRKQEISENSNFELKIDSQDYYKENRVILNAFDKREKSIILKAIIKSKIYKIGLKGEL
ncbi:hypothetical protein [uncultured Eubacterium sp.]|uniref:hypothetical protein n=1 Tax=uncultured Eubacterium sp. TaxID=165185 RepID=UPI00345CDFB3